MGVSKHEERDISFNAVVLFATGLVIALVVVHFVVNGLFRHWRHATPVTSRQDFVGPHLTVNQAQDMEQLRASEDATLNSYGWVDREHGVVRIPIERAMELTAKQK